MSVAELSIDELNKIIDIAVEKKINSYFEEHSFDENLIDSVSVRLEKQLKEVELGERGVNLESVISELGFN